MSAYNFLNYDGTLLPSNACKYDSNIGYAANFNVNGEVDGWELYDGIHTYGCWNRFLFGTLYGSYAMLGRYEQLRPIEAEKFYIVRIVMKLNLKERGGSVAEVPTKGRIAWRTISSPVWNSDKELDFDLDTGTGWYSYNINMGEAQWWQGDISDLRIYPILENGIDGDEFYIRALEVKSIADYRCLNVPCDYYSQYEHNCPGIGERGYCKSKALSAYTFEGSTFEYAVDKRYTITEGVNDVLLVNMNGYGFENVVLGPITNATGDRLANNLAKEISKLDVGGYAEASVEYTEQGEFLIYNGVYADDSTVEIGNNALAKDLNFRDANGNDISTRHTGSNPASGFIPYSSFKIKTHNIYTLLDENERTEFYFNPFIYNLEGGRQDWLEMGLGKPSEDVRTSEYEDSGVKDRTYNVIENGGRTIIDFNHPFNASGRIIKIYAAITLDATAGGNWQFRGTRDATRQDTQLAGARVMFFRPLKNGDLRVLDREVEILDRDHDSGNLYSTVQEYVDIDCDVFVNKGDLIGIYNANVYKGQAINPGDTDALYYQVDGKASGDLTLRQPYGEGTAGLLIYARSDVAQDRLVLELDLGKRINVEDVKVVGSALQEKLEYNVARCLDINWELDLFDHDHTTGWIRSYRPLKKAYYSHPNTAFGLENLTDGIKTVPDGLAADSFDEDLIDWGYRYLPQAQGKQNGGVGVVPHGPKYFWVNGDVEWLGTYHHAGRQGPFLVDDFRADPIAFTLRFPFEKPKLMNKFKIYFKETYNFRSFEVSTFKGEFWQSGDADDPRFQLIPEREDGTETPWTRLSVDGLEYSPEVFSWQAVNLYLAKNPVIGHRLVVPTSVAEVDGGMFEGVDVSYFDELGGVGFYQSFQTTNSDQYEQAKSVDWTILEMEWPPISDKGFRLYCNSHSSTKICEFEVYCVVENITSPMAGSIEINHSSYQDYWWPTVPEETDYGTNAFIGDTPRYMRIIINPITEIELSDIIINASFEDVYMGEKGCQHVFIPEEAKRGVDNPATKLEFKNVYGRPYDLYVDIASPELSDEGLVFYSLMNNEESITNPEIGADAYYRKHEDYLLTHYNYNVAINCPVWKLKNLVDGCDIWYSHDNEYSWKYYGTVPDGNSLDFDNLPDAAITTLNLPVLTRSQWWKIGFYDPRVVASIREIQIYYEEEEIFSVQFYHHKDADAYTTSNSDTAPHLKNNVVDGSYYVLKGDHHIGFKLPGVIPFDRLVIYHDFLEDYENSHDKAGIDKATALCIHGDGETYDTVPIVDESYYERAVTINGTGIYCDREPSDTINYSFTEDFSSCSLDVKTFDEPTIDTSYWTNITNAAIVSGTLNITNSGISGFVETVDYFSGDFSVTTDVTVSGSYDDQGWGCYLEAFNNSGFIVRIGLSTPYFLQQQAFHSEQFSTSGWYPITFTYQEQSNDLRLKLRRDNDTISIYAGPIDGSLSAVGSSTLLGYDPVKFRLSSIVTPLAPFGAVTIGLFDNFYVDNSAADWSVDISESSEFVCVSGIGPTDHAYWYDMGVKNDCDASGFKRCRVYDNNDYPFDEEYAFTFDFTFRGYEFLSNTGGSTNNGGVSVGLLGKHVRKESTVYSPWQYYFTGVQMVMHRDDVHIAIRNEWCEGVISDLVAFDTTSDFYYGRLTSSGTGLYELTVWSGTWGESQPVGYVELESDLRWTAYKVGVGSGHSTTNNLLYRASGWVGDFDFSCTKTHLNGKIHDGSLKFSGVPGERLVASYAESPICNINNDNLNFLDKRFTFDFFISFNSLPPNDGDYAVIAKSWGDTQPLTEGSPVTDASWALIMKNYLGGYRWQLLVNIDNTVVLAEEYNFNPDIHRWHHMLICHGASNQDSDFYNVWLRDGRHLFYGQSLRKKTIAYSGNDVVIGENFDGHIEEFRISCDADKGGGRVHHWSGYYDVILKDIPTSQYERYYTWCFYESIDNIFYGKNFEVDTMFDNTRSYHVDDSYWSRQYYTYLAFDFGRRHDLDIVRSFPVDTSYQFTRTSNILYSNKDTADPYAAFSLTEAEADPSTDFSGMDYTYPPEFTSYNTPGAISYILDDFFYMNCPATGGEKTAEAQANFYFYEDFDFYIDFYLGTSYSQQRTWEVIVEVVDVNNPDTIALRYLREYTDTGNQMKVESKDASSTWRTRLIDSIRPDSGSIRISRMNNYFQFYFKNVGDPVSSFVVKNFVNIVSDDLSPEMHLRIKLRSSDPNMPNISVWWQNFTIIDAAPIYSTSQDARWAKVKMLNGDGETRTVKSVGMYPDITTETNKQGQFNCSWEELGTAITSYAESDNVALSATASGSNYVGVMFPWNANDGNIPDGEFNKCWGAFDDPDTGMWLSFHLLEESEIYRVKIFHGYAAADFNNIITDYKIQVSTDEETFTTIFTVTDNDEMERTHDLAAPVSAKVVRIWIDDYTAINRFLYTGTEDGYQFWQGPCLREVEIYEYYGFTAIDSESSPIIAIDLRTPYFVFGHELIGIDTENPDLNWAHDDSDDPNYDESYIGDGPGVQFAWSNSHLTDPHKVTFSEWGADPGYAKWAVIRRNTATHYPRKPVEMRDDDDTPDYLKHAVIKAYVNEVYDPPNPTEYPWFWRANLSELSYDYDNQTNTGFITRSLKIDYPASSDPEHVRYIEGDHFGWDENASWRDGFGFFLYIDDIDNLDLEYGYFYLGGKDYTDQANPIVHRWNMTTFSGVLRSGWNNLNLTFLYADLLSYTELSPYAEGRDPRRLYSIRFGSMGFVFRGKGNPLTMNFEGFLIERNHFEHGCYPGQRGLYLHKGDVMRVAAGELDFHSGTIEFFIRPDWGWDGRDAYNDFKFRTLFHFSSVANDVFGAAISTNGINVYYGNLLKDFNLFIAEGALDDPIDKLVHMAFVFSNDGGGMPNDASTVRIYINNVLAAKHYETWKVADNKHFSFFLGGQGLLTLKASGFDGTSSAVDGVVSRLKIHNYCKTDFSESLPTYGGEPIKKLLKPDDFIAISKDNVTFHKVGSAELPFFYDDVEDGETIPVWVRVNVPRFGLTGKEKRTAEVLASWDIGV